MKRHQLTSLKVRNAKPGHHADGMGLYLQVSEAGTKSWVFRFMLDGRQREMGLGSAEVFTLAEAREKMIAARKLLHDGIDPIEARLKRRDEARAEAASRVTFKQAAEEYIAVHRDGWRNPRHRQQWSRTLEQHAYHTLGSRPVSAIDAAMINDALSPIWSKIPVTARRLRNRIESVCQWVRHGRPLPASPEARTVKHHAALPHGQVPLLIEELHGLDKPEARALEFLILTAARTGEVNGARWEEIDLEAKTWTISAERMKAGKEHKVPLSYRAVELLGDVGHADQRLFDIGRDAMKRLIWKMRPGVTVHGFRSSFRDWCGERTNFSREVVEHALAHKLPDKVEAAYRRETALAKRRQLMDAWARYCGMPAAGAAAVPLHG